MVARTKQPPPPPAATLDLQSTRCTCGCGETTAARSRFRPGHDQRLQGQLARAHYDGAAVAVLQPDGQRQHLPAVDAARMLDTDRHSWSAKLSSNRRHQSQELPA